MPISLAPRARPAPAGENFALKSMLVASALWLGALVVAAAESNFSPPNHSLSQSEQALPLIAAERFR